MKSITVSELGNRTAAVCKELQAERDTVVIANWRPLAILSSVHPDLLESELRVIRQARFPAVLDSIQACAKARGLDKMTMKEIDALIARVRRERAARRA